MTTRPSTFGLAFASLRYHWRSNLAVAAGVTVAVMTLTGALVVGDSMRHSLRENATAHLGWVDHALVASRFLDASPPQRLVHNRLEECERLAGILMVTGGAVHATTRARSESIQVLGVDESFWTNTLGDGDWKNPDSRHIVLNAALADDIGANIGDDVLIRIGTAGDLPTETLIGRRNQNTITLRLPVKSIIANDEMASLGLHPTQRSPRNAFVPIKTLQKALDQPDKINTILVGVGTTPDALRTALDESIRLADVGLTLRADPRHGYIALESNRFLIEPAIERAARNAANDINSPVHNVLSYLANSLASDTHSIPYSIVSAIDFPIENHQPQPGQIILNQWATDDLQPKPGAKITLVYYVTGPLGQLETETTQFTLAGTVPLSGTAADPGFTPTYPGVTDTDSIADWDPPFPISLENIRPKDDTYWKNHRTTPKAFIALQDGQQLWSEDADRFGKLTAIRIPLDDPTSAKTTAAAFENALLKHLDPADLGLSFRPVRQLALRSATGSTDFGQLFVGFSFFLIASAALLVALLFRLGVEQRSAQTGLLLATGYTPRNISRLLLTESALVATIGTIPGILASQLYASIMLTGLRTWWSKAANAPFLELDLQPVSLIIGGGGGFLVAILATTLAVRSLTKMTPRALFAGQTQPDSPPHKNQSTRSRTLAIACLILAVATLPLPALSPDIPAALIFFAAGTLTLAGLLLITANQMRRPTQRPLAPTNNALIKLGLRNATRNPSRSLTTITLIASATFLIVALQAFQLTTDTDPTERAGPTGGFTLYANTSIPVVHDLNTETGRDALAFTIPESPILNHTTIVPFRLRDGESSSCLNLYKPTQPRILGATQNIIERGGFTFSTTLANTESESANPWSLLNQHFDDAIPAIGDEAAVKWQLHSGLGQDLTITNEQGQPVKLRFVALLKGSALQDELIIAEHDFVKLFPSVQGYGFFLIETTTEKSKPVATFLENQLADHGFDANETLDRIRQYQQVQNTYLSTFQSLGSFGLILGSLGLGAVLARNIVERRSELALLAAVGYSRKHLAIALASENTLLVTLGLAVGFIPACIAVLPHTIQQPTSLPWLNIALTLTTVFVIANLAGLFAMTTLLRRPIIPNLRCE